jgi:hypothetical protein
MSTAIDYTLIPEEETKEKGFGAKYIGKFCPIYQGLCLIQKCVFWSEEGCLYLNFIKNGIKYFSRASSEVEEIRKTLERIENAVLNLSDDEGEAYL